MLTNTILDASRRQSLSRGLRLLVGGVGAWLLPVGINAAVTWPSTKPIKLIVPAQPGGGLDLVARTTADRLARAMGTPWVVENIGGGGGTIACITTARAPADGQTFMIVNISTHGTNPAVRKLPYDPLKDFTHIGMVGGSPNVLVAGPGLAHVNSVDELISSLKKKAGDAAYGSAGPGTSSHLVMEQFKLVTGIELTHVPYRGIGPAMVDFMAGRTDVLFPGLTAVLQHLKSPKLKALAVTSASRHPLLPNVPTFAEIGLKEFSSLQWYGLSGPARLPEDIAKLLNTQLNRVLLEPEVIAKFEAEALAVMPMTSPQFTTYIKEDITRWLKVVKDRKISVDAS
jgi:tripartite-type tricarboxylate transporter receptor subunit TctC